MTGGVDGYVRDGSVKVEFGSRAAMQEKGKCEIVAARSGRSRDKG